MATQSYTLPNISVQFAFQDFTTGKPPTPYSPRQITITSNTSLGTLIPGVPLSVNTLGNIQQSLSSSPLGGVLTVIHNGSPYTIRFGYANNNTLYGVYVLSGGAFTTVANTDYVVTWNWYEANTFTRDFQTKMGRQHELDRTEAATLALKLDNRDGRWYPWNTNTFSYASATTGSTDTYAPTSILTVGVPVRIIATWQGKQYPVFFGYVDAWQPSAPDELNSDTTVQATDIFKLLSLTRLSNSNLYQQRLLAPLYAPNANIITPDLFRCNDNSSIVTGLGLQNTGVTAFSTGSAALTTTSNATMTFVSTSTTATTISNLSTGGGTFTLSHNNQLFNVRYGSYTGTGGIYTFRNCQTLQGSVTTGLGDYIQGGVLKAVITGSATLQQQGVEVYDPNAGGISLGATGSPNTYSGYIALNNVNNVYGQLTNTGFGYTMEGWFKGASVGDTLLAMIDYTSSLSLTTAPQFAAIVGASGQVSYAQTEAISSGVTSAYLYSNPAGPNVTDGNWHLVTMGVAPGAAASGVSVALYVDGVLVSLISNASPPVASLYPNVVLWGGTLASTSTFSNLSYSAATTATVSDIAFTLDVVSSFIPTFAALSLQRYRTGIHFQTQGPTAAIGSAPPTLTPTGSSTLPVNDASLFSTTGGYAIITHNTGSGTSPAFVAYGIYYTGTSGNNLTGVSLAQNYSTFTPSQGDGIYSRTGVYTGHKLLEIAEVVGLVPDDGTSTLTTSPLNLSQGVVGPVSIEPSTTYASSALDYGFQFEDTENGFYYQDQAGIIQFKPRFYPQTHAQNSAQWSDSGTALNQPHYQLNVEVFMDDMDTWEVAQLTTPGGGTTYVVDPTGTYVNQYGSRTFSRGQIWASRQQDVNALGYMIVNRYRQPITRPQKVIIDNTYVDSAGNQPNQLAMLGTNLWDQIVFNHDGYGTNYAQAVVVESIAHDFKAEPGQWQTTFVLSPYEMNGSSTVNAGSFFRISTSSAAADYSKFQAAQTSVASATTISTTASVVPVVSAAALPSTSSGGVVLTHSGTSYPLTYTSKNTSTYFATGLTTTTLSPQGAFDSLGNYYTMSGTSLVKITPAGVVSTLATNAAWTQIQGMACDSSNNVFIAQYGATSTIYKITSGGTVTTFATITGGAQCMVTDTSNNLFVANSLSTYTILKITSAGTVSTFVSGGSLNVPIGLCRDASNNLYVCNFLGNNILKITSAAVVSTFITGVSSPSGITLGPDSNFTIVQSSSTNLYRYSLSGPTSLGNISPPFGLSPTMAQNLAVDPVTNLLYTTQGGNVVRYNTLGQPVNTLLGTTIASGTVTTAVGDSITYSTGTNQDTFGG